MSKRTTHGVAEPLPGEPFTLFGIGDSYANTPETDPGLVFFLAKFLISKFSEIIFREAFVGKSGLYFGKYSSITAISRAGCEVIYEFGKDFFSIRENKTNEVIGFNPPFNIIDKILSHVLEYKLHIIFLLPKRILASDEFYQLTKNGKYNIINWIGGLPKFHRHGVWQEKLNDFFCSTFILEWCPNDSNLLLDDLKGIIDIKHIDEIREKKFPGFNSRECERLDMKYRLPDHPDNKSNNDDVDYVYESDDGL